MTVDIPTIEAGTILIAAATFFGAMVGALTQVGLGWWNRRRSRKNLRLALRSEMKSQMGLDMDDAGSLTSYDDLSEVFPTPIYESNTQALGSLSNGEAKKISQFYTALMAHRGMTGQQGSREENEEATNNMNDIVGQLQTRAIEEVNKHI